MPQVRARLSRSGPHGCGGGARQRSPTTSAEQVGSHVELLVERERLGRTPGFAELDLDRSRHTRHAGGGPRHRVNRKAVARRAACAHVCRVTDKPANPAVSSARSAVVRSRRPILPYRKLRPPTLWPRPPDPAPAQPDAATEPAPKQGWFQRLKAGLTKTSAKLSQDIAGIFTKRKLDADTLQELEDLLIQADLGVETAARISPRCPRAASTRRSPPTRCAQCLPPRSSARLPPSPGRS